MKVSIVMTTYNGACFLSKQLNSLLMQTRKADEVLILDDCSKDETVSIIRRFIEDNSLSHWKLIVNKKNIGFNANFRKGLFESSGDIVFMCDQDDIWKVNKTEKMLFMLKEDILLLASGFDVIDAKGHIQDMNKNLIGSKMDEKGLYKIDIKNLLGNNFAQGCTMAVRKDLIELLKKDKLCCLEHDWSLAILAALKDGCYFYNEALIEYRIHGDNTIGFEKMDHKRRNQRLLSRKKIILEEKKRVDFALQYLMYDEYLNLMKDYLDLRIECIDTFSPLKLIISCLKRFRNVADWHALLGDLISMTGFVRKSS